MRTQRRLLSIASSGLFLLSVSATRFIPSASDGRSSTPRAPATCTLLTTADATKALDTPSQPGKQFIDSTGCMWSNDPAASDTSRRIALNMHSPRSFQFAMHPALTTIKIEPVSGIGDEAFYQIYPNGASPFIWARKGNDTFSIRILTRDKPKPFTLEQEKAKEADLAKAAVSKL